ncbi:transglycosylase SLT domain-containing protein [Gilliamella sp. wkB112]|uniref:transglycosylase SLT domain-containing protein n=1 Tax=Gilliamella sp. wkB112 TaxID=3120257 RepID=UPI0009BEE56A|nr:transglycosylase SLT domain-containing protein [Gilliamella apicola]
MRYLTLIIVFMLFSCHLAPAIAGVPNDARQHQRELTRNARAIFGLDAPVSLFAAQIHQESRWKVNAKSPVGAQGLAQFMPATADWISGAYPKTLGSNEPYNPSWALRALVQYDYWLYQRVNEAASDCDHWGFVLSAYNGGLGWVNRDRQRAKRDYQDATHYWGVVENINGGRKSINFKENRDYPIRIIYRWQPVYIAENWGLGVCDD